MNVIVESCGQAELRCAARQCASFKGEGVRIRLEFCLQTVDHRIQILEVDRAVLISQASGIPLWSGIKTRLKLELMEIRVERTLLIVVVNLAMAEHDVTD